MFVKVNESNIHELVKKGAKPRTKNGKHQVDNQALIQIEHIVTEAAIISLKGVESEEAKVVPHFIRLMTQI